MTRVAIIAPPHNIAYVYGDERLRTIERMASAPPIIVEPSAVEGRLAELADIEVVFSTWGMPSLTEGQLNAMPRFRLLLYAAGSVHGFVGPLLARGVTVMSAWRANGLPVARFALAQIILSLKGYFRNVREYREDPGASRSAYRGPGPHNETVALLGAGAVGRALIELLSPYGLSVVVFDPYLSDADAGALGVCKVTLAEAFASGFVVSNHLADKPEIAGLIDADLLRSMRPGATFVNTARGRTVREDDLVAVLSERPDLTALLDVTHPEPVAPDSPLMRLPNIRISTHIAGAINNEVGVLSDRCIEEFGRYLRGEPLRDAVTEDMLPALA